MSKLFARSGALTLSLLALLAVPSFASAAGNPLSGHQTTLSLERAFLKELSHKQIVISAIGDGALSAGRLSLPVSGGEIDPVDGSGWIEQTGGLRLRYGERATTVTKLTVRPAAGSIQATVGGKPMKLASLTEYTHDRAGFGVDVRIADAKLSGKAARRLGNRLGLGKSALRGGSSIGGLQSDTEPLTVALAQQGFAWMRCSPESDRVLSELFATGGWLGALPPAGAHYSYLTMTSPPAVSLLIRIAGGSIAPTATQGTVDLAGGIELSRGPVSVRLQDLAIDLTSDMLISGDIESVPYQSAGRASTSAAPVAIASLDMSNVGVATQPTKRSIRLTGARVAILGPFATQLNQLFDQAPATEFRPGDTLGVLSVDLSAR
jgi:hypothetical protein